jgi:carbamate kinase
VDGDRTAALVAIEADIDRLVFLAAGPPALYSDAARDRLATDVPVNELRRMSFADESTTRRVDATVRFVTETGRPAVIGALMRVSRQLDGRGGTTVRPSSSPSPSSYSWY